MKKQTVSPTGIAQEFEINEAFFSTTNAKGIITAGNHTFYRVSAYGPSEMVGQPHNLIRHPNMPRTVFRILWETIQGGDPFIGYVVNHAKNGNHYWVLALIIKIPDGYLSVRIKPSSDILEKIPDLYAEMLKAEEAQLASGAKQPVAMQASKELLNSELQKLGFQDYTLFSRHSLNREINSRDKLMQGKRLQLFSRTLDTDKTDQGRQLQRIHQQAIVAYDEFGRISEHLDRFIQLSEGIQEKQNTVQELSSDFQLKALNASLSADQLGAKGLTIGKVTEFLHEYSQLLSGSVKALSGRIEEITLSITALLSHLATARLEIEMLLDFLPEINAGANASDSEADFVKMGRDLVAGLLGTMKESLTVMDKIKEQLPKIEADQVKIRKLVINLNVAQISGLMESQRSDEARQLISMFNELREQVDFANKELEHFETIVSNIMELAQSTGIDMQRLDAALKSIRI